MFFPDELGPANEAMAAGRYAEAGSLYERASDASRVAGDHLTLRMMAALAVKGYGMAGDASNGLRIAIATVDVLVSMELLPEIPGFARKALQALRTQGHAAAADELSAHVGRAVPTWSDPDAPKLPAFCSACGAAVKPAEIVRPTPSTIACHYCGASLAR